VGVPGRQAGQAGGDAASPGGVSILLHSLVLLRQRLDVARTPNPHWMFVSFTYHSHSILERVAETIQLFSLSDDFCANFHVGKEKKERKYIYWTHTSNT
jgi:hypothetical protein